MKEKRRIIIAVGLVFVAVIASYFWLSSERERQLAVQDIGSEPLDVESTVLEEKSLGEIDVTLYVYNPGAVSPGNDFLHGSSKTIYQTENDVLKARQIVNELLKGLGRQKPGEETETRSYLDSKLTRSLLLNMMNASITPWKL